LFRAGRPADALAAFEQAIAKNERNMVARANAAKALTALGRRDEVLAACEAGLALEASSFTLLLASGQLLLDLGRPEEALPRFERAAAAKPREGEPWFRTGLARRAKGDREGALAALAEACG